MNFENDDILDDLKASWRHIESPQFEDADDEPKDDQTKDVVNLLQAAWDTVEVPAYTPSIRAISPFKEWRKIGTFAAAAVLCAITIWSFAVSGGSNQNTGLLPNEVADLKKPVVEVADSSASTTTTILEQGGLLLKKGRVRLILVQPSKMDELNNLENEK